MADNTGRTQVSREQKSVSRRKPPDLTEPSRDTAAEVLDEALRQGLGPSPARLASALAGADGATRARAVVDLQQQQGNAYVQRVVEARVTTQSTVGSNVLQRQTDEAEPRSVAPEAARPAEADVERIVEETRVSGPERGEPSDAGGIGAELEARDALAADPETRAPNAQIAMPEEEEVAAGAPLQISRWPATEDRRPISAAATVGIQRQAPPAPTRARAGDVTLEFIPDEKKDAGGPLGVIHVRVKGAEVARFFARGGPPYRGRDPNSPGHFFNPTPAGRHRLAPGFPVVASVWAFSQLAWGTPMREVDTPGGKDAQYRVRTRWRSTKKLRIPLTHKNILDAEAAVGRARAIPARWDLNDFGKLAWSIRGTKSLIHTTPTSEEEQRTGRPEVLDFSHGCIHIKPSDRDIMRARGYLQGGVRLIVRKYRKRAKWGTPP